jgi:hypothetical protein
MPTTSPTSRLRSRHISPGSTLVFQHEHRIRHEDGSYRRFLCRGVVVAGPGHKPDRIAGSLTTSRGLSSRPCIGPVCGRPIFAWKSPKPRSSTVPGEAALVLRELRDFGVKVYLDEFGPAIRRSATCTNCRLTP